MNLFQKALGYIARSIGLTDPRLVQAAGGRTTTTGEVVSSASVLGLASAWACVNLLAGTIASLPLMVYRTRGGARTVASDHPLYRILHDSPNADQTAVDFWEFICASIELNGNAYAEIIRGSNGRVVALSVPIAPELMAACEALQNTTLPTPQLRLRRQALARHMRRVEKALAADIKATGGLE